MKNFSKFDSNIRKLSKMDFLYILDNFKSILSTMFNISYPYKRREKRRYYSKIDRLIEATNHFTIKSCTTLCESQWIPEIVKNTKAVSVLSQASDKFNISEGTDLRFYDINHDCTEIDKILSNNAIRHYAFKIDDIHYDYWWFDDYSGIEKLYNSLFNEYFICTSDIDLHSIIDNFARGINYLTPK